MKKIILVMSILSLFVGCTDDTVSQSVIPDINDENCTDDVINSIKNKLDRETFSGACFRRPRFTPSPKVQW